MDEERSQKVKSLSSGGREQREGPLTETKRDDLRLLEMSWDETEELVMDRDY